MPPKKRDRPISEEPKSQFEQIQADHELFLQAFEKPTQIYRFLRARNVLSPIFLPRTLAYMKSRSTRKANSRQDFDIDSILEKVEAKHKKDRYGSNYKSEFMNLTFLGFFDQENPPCQPVEVETLLLKICHKKRKDVSSPIMEASLGKVRVPCNPEVASPSKADVIAVGSNHFSHHNGHTVRSYMLLLRVKCQYAGGKQTHGERGTTPLCNGNGHLSDTEDEPLRKKSKVVDNDLDCDGKDHGSNQEVTYGAELVVYDRNRRCLLTDGEYELALQDLSSTRPNTPKKQATWETIMDGKAVGPFEVFSKCPTARFKLSWNRNALNEAEEADLVEQQFLQNNHLDSHHSDTCSRQDKTLERKPTKDCLSPSKRRRIFYQFLYNNNTRQQTEARDDLHCPWCSLNCENVYPLLKHLRTGHARFNFILSEHPKGSRIDVSINEHYDGSYVGNPQDLHSHIGYAFGRSGPVRRTPVTHVLVYGVKNRKPVFDLAEFSEPESENTGARQLVQGHNRLYFHTVTNRPVRPCEIEAADSEGENDPLWLRQKTLNLIEEFTDVNEGEKEIMKMWNLHAMRNDYIADCQLPKACSTFIEVYGERIIAQNLSRNFHLHLANLADFGLIRPDTVYRTVTQLRQLEQTVIDEGRVPLVDHEGPTLDILTADSIL